jgi:hypothetical protein
MSSSLRKDTFNDKMMRRVGVPIVWAWLLAATAVITFGIIEPDRVIPNLEGFVSLIAIVGTLATLIVTSILELWKQEQLKEIGLAPAARGHSLDMDREERRHAMIMERLEFMAEHQLDERHLHMASDHVADISPELGSTRERMTEWKEMGDFVAGGHHHESTDEEVSEPESDEEEL